MRRTITLCFVAALAMLTMPPRPAHAARVLYVTANAVDAAGCGAASRPCRTIGQVLTIAGAGDRIIVGPGVYDGFSLDKPVSLESTLGAAATVVQGAGTVVQVLAGADGSVIGKPSKGFTIRGGDLGITVDAADVVIEDNIVTASAFTAVVGNQPGLVVTGNVISSQSQGVLVRGLGSSVVQNVVQGPGIGRGVLVSASAPDCVVSDNLIVGNDPGVLVRSTATIRRNTFAANGAGIELDTSADGPHLVVSSNNFLGNACAILSNGTAVNASGNYWGRAAGPGVDPADDVCASASEVDTTPFLRSPVIVTITAGR